MKKTIFTIMLVLIIVGSFIAISGCYGPTSRTNYISKDPVACKSIVVKCEGAGKAFSGENGCGCQYYLD